jgi:hypothetical protein
LCKYQQNRPHPKVTSLLDDSEAVRCLAQATVSLTST